MRRRSLRTLQPARALIGKIDPKDRYLTSALGLIRFRLGFPLGSKVQAVFPSDWQTYKETFRI